MCPWLCYVVAWNSRFMWLALGDSSDKCAYSPTNISVIELGNCHFEYER